MNIENKLILELCKFEYADKKKLIGLMETGPNYPYILGHLLYNRVGAMAYYALKQSDLLQKVNREFRNTLKAIYEHDIDKTNSFIESLAALSAVCENFNFPYAFLKGAYLVGIYPKGLRTSNDIDILIRPEKITELTNTLKASGFQQGNIRNENFVLADRAEIISSRMNRGETVPFVKEVNLPGMKYLEIDVNFSLGFKPGTDENVVKSILGRTKPLILNSILTLDRPDFLIHLCAHLYKEATVMSWVEMGRDISLYKFCDIFLFVRNFINREFAVELVRRIGGMRLNKECYYALYHSKELFEIENEDLDRVLESIKPEDTSFMTQIVEPQTGKQYAYDMNYTDWVFCGDRKGKLHET